jgi:hypothetical protein
MSIEAMKQALKKIRAAQQCHPNAVMALLCEADEVLDQAIAEAEKQEPVAKVSKMYVNNIQWLNQIPEVDTLLYTHPQPKREPVAEIALQYPQEAVDWQREQQIKAQASITDQKHIHTSDKQEPVAEVESDALLSGVFRVLQPFSLIPKGTKFYTKPYVPEERQPKPLTDEQFQAIRRSLFRQEGWDGDGWDLALKEAIEAAHGIKENT